MNKSGNEKKETTVVVNEKKDEKKDEEKDEKKDEKKDDDDEENEMKIEKLLDETLKEIETTFKKLQIVDEKHKFSNPYNKTNDHSPKRLYSRLQPVITDYAKYRLLWNAIEKDIFQKFESAIAVSKKYASLDQSLKIIKFLQTVTQSLPEYMHNNLQTRLDEFKS